MHFTNSGLAVHHVHVNKVCNNLLLEAGITRGSWHILVHTYLVTTYLWIDLLNQSFLIPN